MTRILWLGLLTLTLAVAPVAAIAEEPGSGDTEPLPYGEYIALLEQMSTASNDVTRRLDRDSSAADIARAFEQMVELAEVDQSRLSKVIPDPCYDAAHWEMLAYRESVLTRLRAVLPSLEEAKTQREVGVVINAIDTDLQERHPAAYAEPADPDGDFDGSWRNILANLATCPTTVAPNMQRFEYPAVGVAMTLPRAWAEIPRSEISSADIIGAWYSDAGVCQVARGFGDGMDTTAEILEVLLPTSYWAEIAPDYVSATVMTTAGEAVRATFIEQNADPVAAIRNAVYLVPQDKWLYLVQCLAVEGRHVTPADDWLSIAETLELLPLPG